MTTLRLLKPLAGDFEYEVRLNVAIPWTWAKLLKTVGEQHYDYKCRETAKQGIVNALHNRALLNEDVEFHPELSTHPISWRDCDRMLKILEQAPCAQLPEIFDIKTWLLHTMKRISARHAEIRCHEAQEQSKCDECSGDAK